MAARWSRPRLGVAMSSAGLSSVLPRPPFPAVAATVAGPRILLSPPQLTGAEIAEVSASLASGWLAPAGPTPEAFGEAIADITGFRHVAVVASGTAALHLGYRCLDIAPGDEIWAPSLTFVATVAPAVQMGARPRFLDVCPRSWTLDPDGLRRALREAARRGRLPRAVVPVDLFGQCCDLDAIVAACDRWGVPVMTDSAEALGATQRGRHAGKGARLAALSFNGNKIVTAGGGGALASDDPLPIARARFLAAHARERAPHYQHETTGYSYGLSSVLAAVGLAQLPALPERIAARRTIFARYVEGLADLPGIAFMPEPSWGRATRWLTVLEIDPARFGADREAVRLALDEAGMESRPVWKPLHLQPAFRDAPVEGGEVSARLFDRGLCLPSGSGLDPLAQARIVDVIRRCYGA